MGFGTIIPPLAMGAIDRDAAMRTDPDALDRAWAAPSTRVLMLRGAQVPVLGNELVLQPSSGIRSDEHWFLGRLAGAAVFAESIEPGLEHSQNTADHLESSWITALRAGPTLSDEEAELVTMALALQHWHASAAFSPRDGSPTMLAQAGWARIEPVSGVEHFPRTDPAVIVLVEHDNRVLLGSNMLWETGRFSLLAGFVEAGESAEQAAGREVLEESGMRIGSLQYLGSQSWPFPRSLMLGYRAGLAAGQDPAALIPDPGEIAELRWFTRDELREPTGGFKLPRVGSIARWVIDGWVGSGETEARGDFGV